MGGLYLFLVVTLFIILFIYPDRQEGSGFFLFYCCLLYNLCMIIYIRYLFIFAPFFNLVILHVLAYGTNIHVPLPCRVLPL